MKPCGFPINARNITNNSYPHRRLRGENALEAIAVLKEDQYPQYGGHQSRSNARRGKHQVKRENVVELCRKQCQRKWHEKTGEQEQSPKNLHSEKERGNSLISFLSMLL